MRLTNPSNLLEMLNIEQLFRNFTGLSITVVMPEHRGLSDII
jgi:hypothetical protein